MASNIKKYFNLNNLVLTVAAVIAGVLVYDTLRAISQNYHLSQQYDQLIQENKTLELSNKNLELTNQYLASDDYIELAVRSKLGKGAPGDRILIFSDIPEPVDASTNNQDGSMSKSQTDAWRVNVSDWIKFLFRHDTTGLHD